MRFYTEQECEDWLCSRERTKPNTIPDIHTERFGYPAEPYRIFFLARWIATSIMFRQPALLWITEWGIWVNNENLHLYYRLRQSYNDHRLLEEAPGHLFLDDEAEDLASFLQIAMLNGWGGYVLTHLDYVNAFFSHDEYVDFFAGVDANLADVRTELGKALPRPPAKPQTGSSS